MEPAVFCQQLLATIDAADGRRRRRKRDTTPDAIGLGIKRRLLEHAVADRPVAGRIEEWLFGRCLDLGWLEEEVESGIARPSHGAVQAMAASVLAEWQLVAESGAFREWLSRGAPSADTIGHPDAAQGPVKSSN
jgi:hypothetical protein